MFSFVQNVSKTKMSGNDQEALNPGSLAVNPEEVINLDLSNAPANTVGLELHKVAAVDKVQDGYGRVRRSGRSVRDSPYQEKKSGSRTLADHVTREFLSTGGKEGDSVSSMFRIARNYRTEPRGDIQEVLERRGKLYGDNLDPKWFSFDSDLGAKTNSIRDRNKARAMLAAAPLMMAQQGALDLRKIMLEGDTSILSELKLEERTTVAEVLDKLKSVPPLAILKLCNKEVGDLVKESLLQHADDLDFVQDVLDLVGSHSALTPTLHAVLAGFGRRKNHGRFKHGQISIAMDRMRFSHLTSPYDNDDGNVRKRKHRSKSGMAKGICQHFQRRSSCGNGLCLFVHKCIICGSQSHGAFDCKDRSLVSGALKGRGKNAFREKNSRGNSVPVRPRRRRSR